MNKVFIVGNLTRDPELRSTRDGISVCSFTVAVNRRQRNAEAGQPEADFFRVTAWRQLGEICAKYLAKGRKVYAAGPLQARTYTANDGTTRVSLEMNADEIEFLDSRNSGQGDGGYSPGAQASSVAASAPQAPSDSFGPAIPEDEIPF